MSQEAVSTTQAAPPARSFIQHAKLISLLTLASRVLGMARESFAAHYFGAGMVSAAFTVAFTIPNLFRRLFGEGALSAAFIPLYSRSLKEQTPEESARFAAASVNMLVTILVALTILGELILLALWRIDNLRPDQELAIQLTAIMLPYVLLVCGTAFLGAILQVHRRFGMVAAAPIVLNVALIGSTILGAQFWDMDTEAGRINAVRFVAAGVLVAGVLQVLMLLPSLRATGFRFRLTRFWTPQIKQMLKLSIPVALGAGVLQISVLIDRGLAFMLARGYTDDGQLISTFNLFGRVIDYPMAYGAAARLAWAQYLYQFPLGIFAIALATAIFPTLSADALSADKAKFREGLRRGIRVTLWEGLPASVGLILVAQPAVQILFERGRFTSTDTALVVGSLQIFSAAIWAFSLQQILNRAFYALHDMTTPLIMSMVTIVVDLSVKLSLIWSMGEAGMAAGTAISFSLQCLLMLWVVQRKAGSLELARLVPFILKIALATAIMAAGCLLIQYTPIFPADRTKSTALIRLAILMTTGGVVYVGACTAMGVGVMEYLRPKKK